MFGKKLKDYREQKGYTQADFAKKIGVARSTLAKYEVNIGQPSVEVLKNASQVMNCTIDELLN